MVSFYLIVPLILRLLLMLYTLVTALKGCKFNSFEELEGIVPSEVSYERSLGLAGEQHNLKIDREEYRRVEKIGLCYWCYDSKGCLRDTMAFPLHLYVSWSCHHELYYISRWYSTQVK